MLIVLIVDAEVFEALGEGRLARTLLRAWLEAKKNRQLAWAARLAAAFLHSTPRCPNAYLANPAPLALLPRITLVAQ